MTADPVELPELVSATNAREHRLFAGKLVGDGLVAAQRLVPRVGRGIEGDRRDSAAIEDWASGLADTLAADGTPR